MSLTPAQQAHPHRRLPGQGRERARLTYLERSFAAFYRRRNECAQWWASGVVAETMTHPRRGPRLLKAFLMGLSRTTQALNEDERQTWEQLYALSTHRTPETLALALAVFSARDPELFERLMGEEGDIHTPLDPDFPIGAHEWNSGCFVRHTGWTATLAQARNRVVHRRFDEPLETAEKQARHLLARLARHDEPGACLDEDRHQNLCFLTTVAGSLGWFSNPHLIAGRDRLLKEGANPWHMPSRPGGTEEPRETLPSIAPFPHTAVGAWLHHLDWGAWSSAGNRDGAEGWGEALLRVSPLPGTRLERECWMALAHLPDPKGPIRNWCAQGFSPFTAPSRQLDAKGNFSRPMLTMA